MNIPDHMRQMTVEDAVRSLGAQLPRQCEHIKANGVFCGSPALRGRNYCYFHLTHIGRRLRAERAQAHLVSKANAYGLDPDALALAAEVPLDLPPLEDANSVQIALMQVMDAILHNRIDSKRAGLLLYGLQIASSNLRNGANFALPNGVTMAGGYEAFEQDYELGDDLPELKLQDEDEEEEEIEEEEEEADEEEDGIAGEPAECEATNAECAAVAATPEGPTCAPPDNPDGNSEEGPIAHCSPVDQFFCSIMGPMSKMNTGAAQRSPREAASQRIGRKPPTQAKEGWIRQEDEFAA